DHEQAVAGDEEEIAAQGLRQYGRDGHGLSLCSPEESCAVLDDEGEAEGEQETVERVAAIERPDQHPFDHETNECRERRRDQERAPEAHVWRDGIGNVPADDEKSAMGEVDDIAEDRKS